jgi:hypothetical protein
LLDGVVLGIDLAEQFGGILGAVQDSGASKNYLSLLEVAQLLENALLWVDFDSRSTGIYSGAVEESDPIPGSCGGNFSYSITINEATGAFSGTLTFNSYCEEGVIISGSVIFSGLVNVNTSELITFLFDFNALTVNLNGDSATLDGTFSTNVVAGTITINLLVQENNKVHEYENTVLTETVGGAFSLTTITGRYFHPDYGYLDITTPTPFKTYEADQNPSEGILLLVGASNTKTRLTAINNTGFVVEVDTNGDGNWDIDWGFQAW